MVPELIQSIEIDPSSRLVSFLFYLWVYKERDIEKEVFGWFFCHSDVRRVYMYGMDRFLFHQAVGHRARDKTNDGESMETKFTQLVPSLVVGGDWQAVAGHLLPSRLNTISGFWYGKTERLSSQKQGARYCQGVGRTVYTNKCVHPASIGPDTGAENHNRANQDVHYCSRVKDKSQQLATV